VDEQTIAEYMGGRSLKCLAKQHGVHYTKVRQYLVEHGISIRRTPCKTAPYEGRIVEMYRSGLDSVVIGKRLGIAPINVRRCLQRNDVCRRGREEYCRKYPISVEQFRDPSKEVCSYWFGFLLMRGRLRTGGRGTRVVECRVRSADVGHLYQLARDLGTTKVPVMVGSSGSASLSVSNCELHGLLECHGWSALRSGGVALPRGLNLRHWVRGLLDGGGVVDGGGPLRIALDGYGSIRRRAAGICSGWIGRGGRAWTGADAVGLARLLYCDSMRRLSRNWRVVSRFL